MSLKHTSLRPCAFPNTATATTMSLNTLLRPTTANGLTSIPTIDVTAANEFISHDKFQRPAST
jgi:hypothetical protein